MTENGWHKTEIRVRYKDTDRLGVVYYGNYLTFFEVARAEYMREIGYPYSELEAKGYTLVVSEASAKYHGNVGYDAVVTVQSAITEVRPVRVRFDYRVVDGDGRLLVIGHTVHACVNEENKPTRLPPELRKIVEPRVTAKA